MEPGDADRNNALADAPPPRATVRATVVRAPSNGPPREIQVELPSGSTIGDAVLASGLLDAADPPDDGLVLGVFNRQQVPATALRDGDRVEIYRPLTVDPKVARRIRAEVRRRRKGQT